MNQGLAILYYLYSLEAFGEEFHSPIEFQEAKQNTQEEKTLGWNPKEAKIGFISKTPTLDCNGVFTHKKSSQMLENMIHHFFKLSQKQCGIFSFFKSENTQESDAQELQKYKQILWMQILQSPANVFVIFGEDLAFLLFNKEIKNGSKINYKNKTFITTHALFTLLKIPLLKKETLHHLKIAKELL